MKFLMSWLGLTKAQPKEQRYLYMYDMVYGKNKRLVGQWFYTKPLSDTIENEAYQYIGRIKLEKEDETK